MAKAFDESIREVLGSLVFQLTMAQCQVNQLTERVTELEAQINKPEAK